jgi:hypothetical protein
VTTKEGIMAVILAEDEVSIESGGFCEVRGATFGPL